MRTFFMQLCLGIHHFYHNTITEKLRMIQSIDRKTSETNSNGEYAFQKLL